MGQGCSINSFISTHLNKTSISYPKPGPFTVPHSSERRHQVAQKETQSSFSPLSSLSPDTQPVAVSYLSISLWSPESSYPQAHYHFWSIYSHLGSYKSFWSLPFRPILQIGLE